MASTDPDDRPLSGYSFVQWLNGIVQSFRGQSSKQFLLSAGGDGPGMGDAPPVLALAAKTRFQDSKKWSPYYSRMEEAKIKNQIWENDIQPVLEARLRKMFHDENWRRMKMFPHVSSNVLRRIVEDISILYETPANRRIELETSQKQTDGGKAETEDVFDTEDGGTTTPEPKPPTVDTGNPEADGLAQYLDAEETEDPSEEPLEAVMKLCDLDLVLDLVEKMCRFHDAVWVMPKVVYSGVIAENKDGTPIEEVGADTSTGRLTYQIFDPSCADIIEDPDDPSRALAWFYCGWELDAKGVTKMVWHFWTETEYWKFDDEWHTKEHQDNALGRLPITVFRKERPASGSYYVNGSGRDLMEGTLEVCALRTFQNCRFKDGGFKQLALTNADEEAVPADQVMGGPTPLYMPEGASATVLDLQPMLTEMSDMVKDRAKELSATYGTNLAEYKDGGTPQSGFAKKLDRDKVLKENQRIRKFFSESEKDLYALLALTLKTYPIDGVPALPLDGELIVDFCDPSFEEDPKDQAVTDAQNLKLNKTSIIDILKRENPDFSEVELLERAERNRAINAIFLTGDALKLIDLLSTSGLQQQKPGGNDSGAAGNPKVPPGGK